ncbi:RNA polymerase II subunit 5-mediating protein homolog isoform X1 [Tanacetum coccineum]
MIPRKSSWLHYTLWSWKLAVVVYDVLKTKEVVADIRMLSYSGFRSSVTEGKVVLLGEGCYADRTSKQTVEILKRRGKDIESQIENLNGIIKDLKFEATFFDKTATKAAVSSSPSISVILIS